MRHSGATTEGLKEVAEWVEWLEPIERGDNNYFTPRVMEALHLMRVLECQSQVTLCKDCKHNHPGLTCDLLNRPFGKGEEWGCIEGERKDGEHGKD